LELTPTSRDLQQASTASSTSNIASSTITNESRSPITYEKTVTLLKEVLRRSLGNLFNNCLEFHLDTKGFLPKHSFNHSVRGSRSLPKTGHVRSSLLQRHTTCFGLPKVFLQANRDIFTWQRLLLYQRQLRLVLARPRSSSPHVKDLVINPLGPTVIFLQVNK
jgi:hypothetical protein